MNQSVERSYDSMCREPLACRVSHVEGCTDPLVSSHALCDTFNAGTVGGALGLDVRLQYIDVRPSTRTR